MEVGPMSEGFDLIVRVDTMRDYLQTFQSIVSEATLEFGEDGIYAQPVDPANVAMVNQQLSADAFEAYETDGFRLGVNLDRFDDYLSKLDSDTLVNITLDPETRRIVIEGDEVRLTLAGIDPDSVRNGQDVDESAMEWTTDVELPGAAISHAVDVCSMVSNHVTFESDPDRDRPLHAIGQGDTDDARVRFGDSIDEGHIPEPAETMLSEDYLVDLMSVIPDESAVRLQVGDELPIRIDYEYADGAATVQMMVAPRIGTRG